MSNFLENLRIMTLKLLELTQFAAQNLSVYLNFILCWRSVMMLTFLNKPPVDSPLIENSMIKGTVPAGN